MCQSPLLGMHTYCSTQLHVLCLQHFVFRMEQINTCTVLMCTVIRLGFHELATSIICVSLYIVRGLTTTFPSFTQWQEFALCWAFLARAGVLQRNLIGMASLFSLLRVTAVKFFSGLHQLPPQYASAATCSEHTFVCSFTWK